MIGEKTSKIDLTSVSMNEIKKEIERRENLENERANASYEKKKIEEWRKRPPCLLVGRAYGPESNPTESELFTVYVKGNSGKTYRPRFFVTQKVITYFHNSWTNEHERMLQNMVNVLCEYFVDTYINTSLEVTARLIDISEFFRSTNISLENRKIIEKEFKEAAIEKFCEFPLDELKKYVKSNVYSNHLDQLVKKAINRKIKNNIPDKQKIELPKEYKTVLALNKLKDNS